MLRALGVQEAGDRGLVGPLRGTGREAARLLARLGVGELQVLAKPAGRVSLSDDAKNGTITGFGPFSGTLSYVGSETGQDGCSPFSRGFVSGTLTAHWDLIGAVETVSDGQSLTAAFSNFCS